jgi:protein SCO1/2
MFRGPARHWVAAPKLVGALSLLLLTAHAAPSAGETQHDHQNRALHAQHDQGAPQANYQKTIQAIELPDVALVRADGTKVSFVADIDDGRPVLLNFIFTTCTTICPVLSQTFSGFQEMLGPDVAKVHMVSVSIDPEEDTPERLAAYAQQYGAGPQWTHYTGSIEAGVDVQEAFGAYFLDKMNHRPMAFLRRSPEAAWVRLEGFPSPDELLHEYKQLLASSD